MTQNFRIQLYGHQWAQRLLRRAVQQGTTRHSYLFLGPEHIGKTTLARAFAQALTCENPTENDGLGACGHCRSCRLAAENTHPDHRLFAPAGNQLLIEQARKIIHEASLSPVESRYKVFIITAFERANVNTANALLKTLEEPSATTRIILVSHQPSGLLDTIISRCQLLRLRPLPEQTIVQMLMEQVAVSKTVAHRLARLSNGRPGTALTLAQEPEAWQTYNQRIDEMLELLKSSTVERMAFAKDLEKAPNLDTTLQEWLLWWRDVLILQHSSPAFVINQEHLAKLTELANTVPPSQARRFIEAIMTTSVYLRKNVNRQLALEVLLLKAPTQA